jgi:hypothetical protein
LGFCVCGRDGVAILGLLVSMMMFFVFRDLLTEAQQAILFCRI